MRLDDFASGAKVRDRQGREGDVISIHGDWVWVSFGDNPEPVRIDKLEVIEKARSSAA
ncbi:MAG TPA: hypothetical protein VND94_00845 [Terriglobia bacterium]|nr:hypothetical protein [Terriglobia bacterium]